MILKSTKPRIAVGGIEHETAGFFEGNTTLSEFKERRVSSKDFLELSGEENTVIDGFVCGVKELNFTFAPLVWYRGGRGGYIAGPKASQETFQVLLSDLIENLSYQMPIDAVLLSLHGSFAVEEIDDADGKVIEAVRDFVGQEIPIIVVHDLHCNITSKSVNSSDIILVSKTYPHVDMHECGKNAVYLLKSIFEGILKPTMAFKQIPILWNAKKMITSEKPMSEAISKLSYFNSKPGVVSSSIGVGYQWIDSPAVGASTIIVTNDNLDRARKYADELSGWIWERRADWVNPSLKPLKALKLGEKIGEYPIILADQADNSGGGAPGDSTELLRLFLKLKLEKAAILYLVDPEAAKNAHEIGVGGILKMKIGGYSHYLCGPPVKVSAKIMALTNGEFYYDGPYLKGVREFVGPTAWIKQNEVSIILTTHKQQPIDQALCRILGLDCKEMKYLGIKSTGHFRSGFESIAGSIFNVECNGLFSQDFSKLPYKNLGRPVYPLDKNIKFLSSD